jgi:hypothetical protein
MAISAPGQEVDGKTSGADLQVTNRQRKDGNCTEKWT